MWSPEQLRLLDEARELEITVDGGPSRWTPIWVVCTGGHAYARTWYRRDTGWFGAALRSRRARIRVPGLAADVTIEEATPEITAEVDAAYRAKYPGGGTDAMVTAEAAATTLRLDPR
ncbi:DUF2255 family protein [Amycolatopsis lexingtonensis]|uniref:DUF2255 family protein n=1 Tax=Amycolatopsis lexingtonensis TaxID=218822 RepID=UPI003F6F82C5